MPGAEQPQQENSSPNLSEGYKSPEQKARDEFIDTVDLAYNQALLFPGDNQPEILATLKAIRRGVDVGLYGGQSVKTFSNGRPSEVYKTFVDAELDPDKNIKYTLITQGESKYISVHCSNYKLQRNEITDLLKTDNIDNVEKERSKNAKALAKNMKFRDSLGFAPVSNSTKINANLELLIPVNPKNTLFKEPRLNIEYSVQKPKGNPEYLCTYDRTYFADFISSREVKLSKMLGNILTYKDSDFTVPTEDFIEGEKSKSAFLKRLNEVRNFFKKNLLSEDKEVMSKAEENRNAFGFLNSIIDRISECENDITFHRFEDEDRKSSLFSIPDPKSLDKNHTDENIMHLLQQKHFQLLIFHLV